MKQKVLLFIAVRLFLILVLLALVLRFGSVLTDKLDSTADYLQDLFQKLIP